jgi:hypothetical protein
MCRKVKESKRKQTKARTDRRYNIATELYSGLDGVCVRESVFVCERVCVCVCMSVRESVCVCVCV